MTEKRHKDTEKKWFWRIIDSIEGKGVVKIYDMLGRPMSEYGVTESARIPTSAFADGIYIIQMSDENGVKVQKVVID